tara:strand:- start:432 stop:1055 length:624 start_codon:yes stop_codon:yes gene_type:complete
MVIGTLPTKTDGVEDNNVRVRAKADPNVKDPTGLYQPPSTYAPVYPYNNVMETESGHVKEYDDTPGAERITERHKSGTRYEVDPNGTKNETIVRDKYCLVAGHDTLEVYGNVKIIVSGAADIAVSGNLTVAVGGNMESTITGTAKITSTDDMTLKSDNIKLDGDVNITGDLTVDKTTTTSKTQTVDSHTHTIAWTDPSGSGNTGELS